MGRAGAAEARGDVGIQEPPVADQHRRSQPRRRPGARHGRHDPLAHRRADAPERRPKSLPLQPYRPADPYRAAGRPAGAEVRRRLERHRHHLAAMQRLGAAQKHIHSHVGRSPQRAAAAGSPEDP